MENGNIINHVGSVNLLMHIFMSFCLYYAPCWVPCKWSNHDNEREIPYAISDKFPQNCISEKVHAIYGHQIYFHQSDSIILNLLPYSYYLNCRVVNYYKVSHFILKSNTAKL